MKTVRLRLRGRVQGVGYRAWAIEAARSLGLRGWVRNRTDGSVEILATGAEDAILALMETCRRGPAAAQVDELTVIDDQEDGTQAFAARPTK